MVQLNVTIEALTWNTIFPAVLCYSHRAHSYNEYIDQHALNKIQYMTSKLKYNIFIYRVALKERMSLGPHAHQIYLPAISFFGVTSNQKSAFENLVQSTI